MPIKRLMTPDNAIVNKFPRIAKLHKGESKRVNPKTGKELVGKDLDYFRVVFEEEYKHLEPIWGGLYQEKLVRFSPCYFAADTAAEAFSFDMEEWGSGETLLHRCDGEFQCRWFNRQTGFYSAARIACVSGGENGCKCKPVGRLNLLLPEFIQYTGVLGYIMVETHSEEDIRVINQYLETIERNFGTLRGVPFTFGRAARKQSTPKTDKEGKRTGERMKVSRSLFYIRVEENFTRERLLPVLAGALPAPVQTPTPQLPSMAVDEAKAALTGGDRSRRIGGSPASGNGSKTGNGKHWTSDPERWEKFLTAAQERFGMDEGDALQALENAVDYAVEIPADFHESERFAAAALVAAACEYDSAEIDKRTSSGGYTIETRDIAITIAERMHTDAEQPPAEETAKE